MSVFRDERVWRILCNAWTVIFIAFVVVNFFVLDRYAGLVAPLSALYAGVLTIYVGTKEFDRWYDIHDSRHPGELFVILWTILTFTLFVVSFLSAQQYRISSEIVADYILVLTVFALTQKSKRLHRERKKPKQERAHASKN